MKVNDGEHRTSVAYPSSYTEYSRTSSGWTIFVNPQAEADKRWRISHPIYGERFFAEHDKILPWTLDHMRGQITKEMKG